MSAALQFDNVRVLQSATFAMYAKFGFPLCAIEPGSKGPRTAGWNKRENAITEPARAAKLQGAGLLHVPSGTCALDIDDLTSARAALATHGINLDELLTAPDAVQISSGREGRGKLLFRVPHNVEPSQLVTKRITEGKRTIFELRCADAKGNSVQDVLPGSIHPETEQPYVWKFATEPQSIGELFLRLDEMPELPAPLLKLWRELLGGPSSDTPAASPGESPEQSESASDANETAALAILAATDPDCDYDTWIRLGMALEHDLGERGWQLWSDWSAKGTKYPGEAQLTTHWNSFGKAANPVTLGSFKRQMISAPEDFEDLGESDPSEAVSSESFEALKRARVHTWRDISKQPWPEWLIRRLLPRKELVQFYGPSGIGKSAVALDMALSLHLGRPFLAISVKQRRVLWIAAEAFGSMRLRLTAYAQANEINADKMEGFEVLAGCNLNDKQEVAFITWLVTKGKYEAVFVDTLAAASPGTDENSGKDMGLIRQACLDIVRPSQATCVLIHHTGKDESRGARGHSSNRAAVDAELRAYFDDELGSKVLSTEKMRDGSDDLAWMYELRVLSVGIDDEDEVVTSVAVKFGEAVSRKRPDQREQPQSRPETGEAIEKGCAALFDALSDLDSQGIKATRSAVEASHPVKAAGFGVTSWRGVMKLLEEQDLIAPAGRRGTPLPITLLPAGEARRAQHESLVVVAEEASNEGGA